MAGTVRAVLCSAFLVMVVCSATAAPVAADHSVSLDDVDLGEVLQTDDTAKLKAKLEELDKTYDRIKSSCAANSAGPSQKQLHEMEAKQAATIKAENIDALKRAIKAKNKLIDKIADECMPGRE